MFRTHIINTGSCRFVVPGTLLRVTAIFTVLSLLVDLNKFHEDGLI